MNEEPIFEVKERDGHEWKIYASGRIEGFPDRPNTLVINRIPIYTHGLCEELRSKLEKAEVLIALSQATGLPIS